MAIQAPISTPTVIVNNQSSLQYLVDGIFYTASKVGSVAYNIFDSIRSVVYAGFSKVASLASWAWSKLPSFSDVYAGITKFVNSVIPFIRNTFDINTNHGKLAWTVVVVLAVCYVLTNVGETQATADSAAFRSTLAAANAGGSRL